jgi:hypothetical protein
VGAKERVSIMELSTVEKETKRFHFTIVVTSEYSVTVEADDEAEADATLRCLVPNTLPELASAEDLPNGLVCVDDCGGEAEITFVSEEE